MKQGWENWKLKDIGDIFSGNSINAKVKEKKYSDLLTGMPYIATKDISYNFKINYDNGISIPDSEIDKFRIAKNGSVFICAEGGSAGRKLGIINQDVCFVNKLFALTANEKAIGKYVFYWYQSNDFQKDFQDKMTGLIGGVSKSKFQNIWISIPPIEEQKQIVEILDKAFEAIDKAKANIEKNIQNTKELFQSRVNKIFSQKDDGWKEKKLEELSNDKKSIVSGPFGSNLKVADYRDSGVPIIRLQNVGKGYFIEKDIKYIEKEKAEELKSHSYVVGDIVLAKLGIPIGKTCIVPENFEDGIVLADIVRIRPDKNKVNYKFLEYFLNTDLSVSQLTKNISGATRPRVNLSNVRNIVVPIPSFGTQNKLVIEMDKLSEQTKQLEEKYQQKLDNLEELKKSILQKAFSGELLK